MIRVLVVDDSLVQQELLKYILSTDAELCVVDCASDGEQAIAKINELKPDVVTMDIHMPKMNGIEATEIIMSEYPLPIVIISGSYSAYEVSDAFKAIEAGALAVVDKINFTVDDPSELINTVKICAGVTVVKRKPHLMKPKEKTQKTVIEYQTSPFAQKDCKVIAIGVSTGGPLVLKQIFESLTHHFPPILVVQHISPGFLPGLAEWLQNSTAKDVHIAVQGEALERGKIYLAPDSVQMEIDSTLHIALTQKSASKGHMPSVNALFHSVAENIGKQSLGILLTGMGTDGAEGLKSMKDKGAHTIAQDKASAIIYGMPGEALALNAATEVLSPSAIAEFINKVSE